VREALERHRGNRTAAAGELGLSRQGLAKVMRRLGLRPGGNGTPGMP
jgi:transcriptional regulator with PAS, ATPase and Fis domain